MYPAWIPRTLVVAAAAITVSTTAADFVPVIVCCALFSLLVHVAARLDTNPILFKSRHGNGFRFLNFWWSVWTRAKSKSYGNTTSTYKPDPSTTVEPSCAVLDPKAETIGLALISM